MTKLILLAIISLGLQACASSPSIDSNDTVNVIEGGLYPVKNSRVDVAYADPDADFSQYHHFILNPLFVDKVSVVQPEIDDQVKQDWQLTQVQKERLQQIYRQAMIEQLNAGDRYKVVEDKTASAALWILADVVAIHPIASVEQLQLSSTASQGASITGVASITIAVTMVDSVSERVLLRMVDTQAAYRFRTGLKGEGPRADVEEIFSRWATKLRTRIDRIVVTDANSGGDE